MNFEAFRMTLPEIIYALTVGGIFSLIFLYLLWETVKLLPRVKHKILFLHISRILRIFLLLCAMVLFSDKHAGKFLMIFCGFMVVRLVILRFISFKISTNKSGKPSKKHNKKGKK